MATSARKTIEMYKARSAHRDKCCQGSNSHLHSKHIRGVANLTVLSSTLFLALTTIISSPSAAASIAAGKAFAQANCSHCHSIDKFTPSTFAIAPPFRTLHERYPVESLEEALAEGIVTGHPNMPEFRLDPGQVSDFIIFLKSLEK